jgi:hypothetical protein
MTDGSVLILQRGNTQPSQIYLPTLNGGLGGFVPGATPLPFNLPFPLAIRLEDGRVLVVEALGCQIYTP